MKKVAFLVAAMGAGVAAQSVYAADTYRDWLSLNPQNASFTIALSGACSGKITVPVTYVAYSWWYSDDGSEVYKGSPGGFLSFGNDDISVEARNDNINAGEKLTESVKNGTRTVSFTTPKDAASYFNNLADGSYDDRITCKDGQPLSHQLQGWSTWENDYETWGPSINWSSVKSSGSLLHTNSTDAPNTGAYKVKFTSSGTMELPGGCTVKGVLGSDSYSRTCVPAKVIKVKITASASGTSELD